MSESGNHRVPRALRPHAPIEEAGGVSFDERGNAVWTPRPGIDNEAALRRLMEHPSLAIVPDTAVDTQKIAPNPVGLRGGYDPYDSGTLGNRKRQPKKDLGRRSKWIVTNRKSDAED